MEKYSTSKSTHSIDFLTRMASNAAFKNYLLINSDD